MERDFTLSKYEELLKAAIDAGYRLTSYQEYLEDKSGRTFILRHDVDKLPFNSLATAKLQYQLGVKGSYYFRIVKESFNTQVIKSIADLGHEIGYHYEDVALTKGDLDKAFSNFQKHLDQFKPFYDVKTICMHGSPMSKWDNKLLWSKYNYRDLGILAEPYFDIDFHKVLYITDTGRSWNKTGSSVRDLVDTGYNFIFNETDDIINAFENKLLPDVIMQNIHPQRWSNNYFLWAREYVLQNIKNIIKRKMINYAKQKI